ncbi:hypothetical protein OUZ56_024924 [Daphnia magna]|uniref:Uncharacterized protein n=1 Tax=Daphnia magna TaxID=35525 RepID=A0ABQ9ZID7_9CRUS|nr:hypothetical protein OUZ56_024924 [Daphnia magna]
MCQLVVPGRKKKEINGDDCQNTRRRPSANKRKRLEEAEMKVETAVATIITRLGKMSKSYNKLPFYTHRLMGLLCVPGQ